MAQLLIKGTKVAEVVGDTTSLIANTLYHPSGTQIITDDGGTVGLTNVSLQNINFDNVANNAISGDKIHGGTISGSELDSSVSFPSFVGMIASFAMSSAPTGWIVCNGAEYAIADYGDLHTAIGTTWGALTNGSGGAGSTHFRVPDLRGEFLRGFDNGQGNDPDAASRTGGDAVGSSQSHDFGSHYHTQSFYPNGSAYNYAYAGLPGHSGGIITASTGTGAAGGNETRPRNKYVQYCIKY